MGIPIDKKRNVAVIAHRGAGKTSLAECMLYNAKSTDKLGRVDDESSVLDFEPEEQKRKLTISLSIHHYDWDGRRINIIDTPGYSNFLSETRNSLSVVGGSVLILSAISGVKVQTEQVWGFADEFNVARVAFVNKMDRESADFFSAVKSMEDAFGVKGVPLQMPIGRGDDFKGLVDLLTMKAYIYGDDFSGKPRSEDLPDELKEQAESMRETLVEAVAETDEALTEKYLEGVEFTMEELLSGLRSGVLAREFVPILLGSAYKNMGVDQLMHAVNKFLPSPVYKGKSKGFIKATDYSTGEEITIEPDVEGTFLGIVFKTIIDPFTGKLSVIRIYSGTATAESVLFNPTRGTKEKAGHLYLLEGKKTGEVKQASAGDIVAVPKLKDTHTGDTLCGADRPVTLPELPAATATLSYAVTPRSKADEEKVPTAMAKLMEEDPSLEFKRDKETNEFILSGTGQLHLEVSVEKLKRKYGCEVELKSPRIPYKETIRSTVKVQGKYKKQSGGRGQYGDTWLEVGPLASGEGFRFENAIVGGVIPKQYIPAVEKGVKEAMQSGVLAGYPVVDVKVKLYDGSHHSVDSSEMAFKIAASMGFKKAVEKAKPILLEPIVSMEINVPDENLGDIIGDLNSRRGRVLGVEAKSGGQAIKTLVPMAEVTNYANDLNGMTGERGIFTMEFSSYEEVPSAIADKVIEGLKKEEGS